MFDGRELARKLFMNVARYSGLASALTSRSWPESARSSCSIVSVMFRRRNWASTAISALTPGFLDAVLTTMKRMGYEFVSMDGSRPARRAGGLLAAGFAAIHAG